MGRYYDDHLSAERLRRCYEIAPPRVQQYLQAEIEFVLGAVRPNDHILELGCGYGRVMRHLSLWAGTVIGIDTSLASLKLAQSTLNGRPNCFLACMDAARLALLNQTFDVVACIQNGLSAFHVDQHSLVQEAVRVTRPGATILFSIYAEAFWGDRLHWFELQAKEELLGEIDYAQTGDGRIICKDGFTATTVGPDDLLQLAEGLPVEPELIEVDHSSLFCRMIRCDEELRPRSAGKK